MINYINNLVKTIKKIINIKKIKKNLFNFNLKINKEYNNFKKKIIINKKISKYKKIIYLYKEIIYKYKDFKLLCNFYKEDINNDRLLYFNKINKLKKKFDKLIFKKIDELGVIIQINSGAGGNDSCNWVNILLNMYKEWAIKKNFKYNVIDQEIIKNGYKYVIFEIIGKYSYGYLKGEKGIHKLIRISPFNNKRHTSFASVDICPLLKNNNKIYINNKDLVFQTFRSSGSGGQNINKVETGVRLIHKPTNITIKCTKTRSQIKNKEYAINILKSKLANINKEKKKKKKHKKKIEWGNHTRTYIMHPYKLIKDLKTGYITTKLDKIIKGNLDDLIGEYIKLKLIN
ncbi:MAG: PCRF domain-containing protein [Candidatus Shikimatogenerans bostrichidophilus]|nr:MAG: PCRF domain-containing protein [Candidatus Shikimatogenerans bostrichidophilus]